MKTHLGNIKRELARKEPLAAGSRDVEKGAVFQVQKMLYGTMGMLESMEKKTDRTIQRLDSLGERAKAIQRPSVKESLRSLQEKQSNQNQESLCSLREKQAGNQRRSSGKKKAAVR